MSEPVHLTEAHMHKNLLPGIIPGLVVLIISFITGATSASEIVLSPDKNISLIISVQEKSLPYPQEEYLYYSIYFKDKKIVKDSPLGLNFYNFPPVNKDLRLYNVQRKKITGSFVPVSGTPDTSYVEYNQILLYLQEKRPPFRFFTVEFVLSNYGAAFRYHIPLNQGISVRNIKKEDTGFYFSENYTAILPAVSDSNESETFTYSTLSISQINDTLSIIPPLLMQASQNLWIEITETNVKNSNAMRLKTVHSIRFSFAEAPYKQSGKDMINSTFTAWRVVLIGENPGKFSYSSFINLLSRPRSFKDVSWIKGGSYLDFQGNVNTDSLLHSIDFCEKNKINYITIPVQAKPDSEQIRHVTSLATNKDVNVILRTSRLYLAENCRIKMSDIKRMGVAGIFVDISKENKNAGLITASEILDNAAANNLIVGFKGNGNFSGLAETYPNFLTLAPDFKYIFNKAAWGIYLPLTTIPYSQMISSPVDLCAVYYDNLKSQGQNSTFDISTILALNILTNSSLRMRNNSLIVPEFKNFLYDLPSSWDKTIFIDGKPGKFIILARRTGSTWYVSAISNSYKKTLSIPLKFLDNSNKQYKASIYFKNPHRKGKTPAIITEHLTVKSSESLNVNLIPGGGYTAVIKPDDK